QVGQELLYRRQLCRVLLDLCRHKRGGTAQFMVFVIEAIGIADRVKAWVQRNGHGGHGFFTTAGEEIRQCYALLSLLNFVLVSDEQISLYTITRRVLTGSHFLLQQFRFALATVALGL